MLYDLNIPWSTTQNCLELQRIISFLSEVGYDTVAMNYTITGSLPPQITNPIPLNPPFTIPPKTTLLRRCTLQISDPSLNHRLGQLSSVYDILALRPTTEKAFLAACQTLTEHSLISLDLTQRFPFHFKPKPFMTAVNRGVRFEICYAQATMEDSSARRNFISNCLGILRATKGRGLVVSSEAKSALGVRAPADVINLLAVWGLGRESGIESLGVNPRGVVVNEGLKRSSFRGVVDVIEGGETKAVNDAETGNEKGKETNGSGIGKKYMGKRKPEEINGEDTAQISKRQAKKLRLAALKAGKEPASKESTPTKEAVTTKESYTPSTTKNKANG